MRGCHAGENQDLAPRLRALTDAECDLMYQEEASVGQADRREPVPAIIRNASVSLMRKDSI